jgi:hypothetical protein
MPPRHSRTSANSSGSWRVERQFLRIGEEVSLEPDLAAAGRAITSRGETNPAMHFGRVKGYTNAQVVLKCMAHGCRRRALASTWPRRSSTAAATRSWSWRRPISGAEVARRRLQAPGATLGGGRCGAGWCRGSWFDSTGFGGGAVAKSESEKV